MALSEGWNQGNVNTLKSNIHDTFATLSAKTDMLDNIYATVAACWKGPDADKYLEDIHTKAVALIDEVAALYSAIDTEIDGVATAWDNFQKQGLE